MKKDTTLNNIMIVECVDLPKDFEPQAELKKCQEGNKAQSDPGS